MSFLVVALLVEDRQHAVPHMHVVVVVLTTGRRGEPTDMPVTQKSHLGTLRNFGPLL